MDYELIEDVDIKLVEGWFSALSLHIEAIPTNPSVKTPDLRVDNHIGECVGLCEVKSIGLGPWEWREKNRRPDGIYTFDGNRSGICDPVKVRLANSIVGAWRQLKAFDPDHQHPWIVAIASHDPFADRQDVQGVLIGRETIGSISLYDESINPNKQIRPAVNDIDLILWFDRNSEECAYWNDLQDDRCVNWPAWLKTLSGPKAP